MSYPRTPFIGQLDSFFCPNDDDISAIQTLISEPRARLVQINMDITKTMTVLKDLEKQRRSLRRYIFSHESLLAPIRRLPPYLLQEIFLACLPTEHNAVFDISAAPLLFGTVCRYWRKLSHETPLLWSSFFASGDPRSGYYPRHNLNPLRQNSSLNFNANAPSFGEMLDRWFSRAGSSPIRISYKERHVRRAWAAEAGDALMTSDDQHGFNATMLRAILNIRSRIESLDVWSGGGNTILLESLLSQQPESMPALKHARFVCDTAVAVGSGPAAAQGLQVGVFEKSVILQNLNLKSICLVGPGNPLEIPLPWSHLSVLRLVCKPLRHSSPALLGGLDLSGAHQILARCPRLICCDIAITQGGDLTRACRVALLSLEELFLGSMMEQRILSFIVQSLEVEPLLHLLDMPKLRAFGVGASTAHEICPRSLLLPGEQVTEFNTSFISLSSILEALREVPQTTTLRLIAHDGDVFSGWGPSYATFFQNTESEQLVPRLRHLYIEVKASSLEAARTGIVPLLSSSRTLQTITLRFPTEDTTPDSIKDELLELGNSHSIRIEFVYPPPEAPTTTPEDLLRLLEHFRNLQQPIDLVYQEEE
ncbi:WD40 repeat-like protein [Mycena indigotica]|uniref:WD40 repeat-like protein n=1 Tax=Mycena indigotica TaxID=2126181 RepID=A0A8H6SFS0_9AGAR|nr:WD40 repeat-like protein [Mycena indigotica]KAF7298701.1 WD40 repeat-like protein [Mycena indigotica]